MTTYSWTLNTRRSNKLRCENRRFCVRSNTVRHNGFLLWNSLIDDICKTYSFTLFKNNLRSYLRIFRYADCSSIVI